MVARRNPIVPRSTVRVAGRAVLQTTVTARPAVARRWLHTALWRHGRAIRSAAGLTVGLGVQWTPALRKLHAGAELRPATLQLCSGSYCLVFQLARADAVPRILRRFLAHARVTFAAYNAGSDLRKLRAHHGLEVASALELRGAAGVGGNASLADMAERLLGIRGVEKSAEVATSEWHGERLSCKQVRYATVDAYLSYCLGVHLRLRAMAGQESESEEYSDDDESMSSEASSDWD